MRKHEEVEFEQDMSQASNDGHCMKSGMAFDYPARFMKVSNPEIWSITNSLIATYLPKWQLQHAQKVSSHIYVSSSSTPLNLSSNGPCLVQIFMPSLYPLVTGNPACIVAGSPTPSSPKFCQNTAFPGTGLNVTPFSHGSSQSTNSHHLSSYFPSKTGKFVPPPVKFLAAT
jgi:hypothetical protein